MSRSRYVCHSCGFKYPIDAVCKADCCTKPELHVHNVDKPCPRCEDLQAVELGIAQFVEVK